MRRVDHNSKVPIKVKLYGMSSKDPVAGDSCSITIRDPDGFEDGTVTMTSVSTGVWMGFYHFFKKGTYLIRSTVVKGTESIRSSMKVESSSAAQNRLSRQEVGLRAIKEPGQTVRLKTRPRDADVKALFGTGTYQITNSEGAVVASGSCTKDADGWYIAEWQVPLRTMLGAYTAYMDITTTDLAHTFRKIIPFEVRDTIGQ